MKFNNEIVLCVFFAILIFCQFDFLDCGGVFSKLFENKEDDIDLEEDGYLEELRCEGFECICKYLNAYGTGQAIGFRASVVYEPESEPHKLMIYFRVFGENFHAIGRYIIRFVKGLIEHNELSMQRLRMLFISIEKLYLEDVKNRDIICDFYYVGKIG